jgi:hypothetical protein
VVVSGISYGIAYMFRTVPARIFDLHSGEDLPFLTSRAFLLVQLSFSAKLLEDHLGVAATVAVGVVEAHFEDLDVSSNAVKLGQSNS